MPNYSRAFLKARHISLVESCPGTRTEEVSSSSEEEGEVEGDKTDYDLWRPIRQKMWHDLKELYTKEVQRFLDRGKPDDCAENGTFNDPLPVCRGRLRRTYLEQRLKWIYRMKLNAIHRKVMKIL